MPTIDQSHPTRLTARRLAACVFLAMLIAGGILFGNAVRSARTASLMSSSNCHLKQFGLAFHNYHDVYGTFPPGNVISENGDSMLSWQTLLLPYLNQKALYDRINLNEPWTSAANQKVYSEPFRLCTHPSAQSADALSLYAGNLHVLKNHAAMSLRQITDGTSQTILTGEVSAGLKAWGDPTNVRDPALGLGQTATQFWGPFRDRTQFGMADGSVRKVSRKIDPKVLKALATPSGGEKIGDFWDQ